MEEICKLMKRFGFILLMLATLALSCTREPSPVHDDSSETVFKTIHYKAQVSSSGVSKATTADNDTKYVFQATDSLYVCSTDPVSGDTLLFGVLKLIYGSGATTAYFEGDLVGVDEFEPASNTPINVTLVSSGDRIHTTGGGKLTDTAYPSNEFSTTLAEAVQKFSHFTCSTTFGATRFTLNQNSSFIICKIKIPSAELPAATSVNASLESGGNTIWEGAVTSTANGTVAKLDFVIPLEGGSVTLSGASISFEWTALEASHSQDFALSSSATLAANNYYTINKSSFSFDGFRIKGTVDNTTVTFNYNYANSGIKYSKDEGLSWTEYTAPFTLNDGEEVCIQGNRANYKNVPNNEDAYGTPGSTPIFTSNNKVYISGNIMSLLADKENLVASAFHGAFSKGTTAVTYIDIDPDADLILPSTTLPASCYQQMFRNCTSLTKAPVFRAENVNYRCCYNMFRQCSNLKDASRIELPDTTLAIDCYRELFRLCEKLDTISRDLLPATTLAQGCYQQMFQKTKIVTAPILPAPTLVQDCYSEMFSNCSALQNVTCLATSISASNCLYKWMDSVKSGGTLYKDTNMSGWIKGTNVPSSWNISDYSPPANP